MALIVATNQQGQQVVAEAAEAKAYGWTPVGQPAQTDSRSSVGVTSGELVQNANAGGGILQTTGSTYDIKPSPQAVQNNAQEQVQKTSGEPVRKVEDVRNPRGQLTLQYFKGESGRTYAYDYSKDQLLTYGSRERIAIPTQMGNVTLSEAVTKKVGGKEGLDRIYMIREQRTQGQSTIDRALASDGSGVMSANFDEYVGRRFESDVYVATNMIIDQGLIQPMKAALLTATFAGLVEIPYGAKIATAIGVGYPTYEMSKDYFQGTLTTEKTMIYSVMIGASVAAEMIPSILSARRAARVDPILKDINVKGLYEDLPKKMYVPKLGYDGKIAQSTDTLRVRVLGDEPILGKPQSTMPVIKPYDQLVEVGLLSDDGVTRSVQKVVFKLTKKGIEPAGQYINEQFIPFTKPEMFHVLDSLGPEGVYTLSGQLRGIKVDPVMFKGLSDIPSSMDPLLREVNVRAMNRLPDRTMDVASVRWFGIEKPKQFTVESLKGKASKATIGEYPSYDVWAETRDQTLFEKLGLRDLTDRGMGYVDLRSGKIVSRATEIAEVAPKFTFDPAGRGLESVGFTSDTANSLQLRYRETSATISMERPAAIGFDTVNVRQPVFDMLESGRPVEFSRPVYMKMRTTITDTDIYIGNNQSYTGFRPQAIGVSNVDVMNLGIKDRSTQFSLPRMSMRMIDVQSVGQNQRVSQNSALREMQVTDVTTIQRQRQPQTDRYKDPTEENPLTKKGKSGGSAIIFSRSPFGKMRSFKVSSFNLPTASAMSLEKAYSKFGHAGLARGPKFEKAYRQNAESYGLGSVGFPAAELIRRLKR